MTEVTDAVRRVSCRECDQLVRLVDEHDRCERCVIEAGERASCLMGLDEHLDAAREIGFSAGQIIRAVMMRLEGKTGPLPNDFIERNAQGWWGAESNFHESRDGNSPRIRHLRGLSGLTLDQLAEQVGVEPPELALWEQGGGRPPDDVLERLAEAFGFCTVEYVMNEEG